ncbi:uncharacterized protein LOC126560070 [Anopheles maculipalpis]|uniref:uncharacterized protein LOC126560070 n=1 Tax=Anopheles maculipalpis TaxID=1496333 RepID=UPI0021598CDC|nr:uncharacterized protein LOC126560070 [Anopheles maculipalpis]
METIQLKSRDGKTFTVQRTILARSTVLQKKLDELESSKANGDILDVPEADGESLSKLVQWMNRQASSSQEGTENGTASQSMIPNNQEQEQPGGGHKNAKENGGGAAFDKEWFSSIPQLCVLIAVAHRLRLVDFVDAAVSFVIEWREGKHLEDIREMMENQFTSVCGPNQAADGTGTER